MSCKEEGDGVVELALRALQANKEHLDALKTHTEKLEAELESLDKLLDAVDVCDESDLDPGCSVTIPGSVRAIAPVAAKDLLSPESPFREDALKRIRYQGFSEVHPMKPRELEALAEAVRAEGCRKHALDIQKSGGFPAFQDFDAPTTHVLPLDAEDIDWSRIAEKISAISMTPRTERECEIRWLGEQHPQFNHGPWSQEEVLKVKSLAAEFTDSRPDWVAVTKRLGTRRTPLDCMRHATLRKVHQWTTEADERLLKAICMYGHNNWHLVARHVSEDATPSQCSSRFEKTLDQSIKRTPWSPEEDARLSAAVAAYGSSWVDVAAHIPGRHNDQCRERWTEHVNPGINKSRWSKEEDKILCDYVSERENASWKDVSEHLSNGRTEAMCRNRYTTLQKSACTVQAMSSVHQKAEVHAASADQTPTPVSPSSTTVAFKSAAPTMYSAPTILAPSDTESHHPNKIVFLEPVISLNHESHEYHRQQQPTRFKMTAVGDIQPPSGATAPPSKKRKSPMAAKSKIPARKAQLQESTSRDPRS